MKIKANRWIGSLALVMSVACVGNSSSGDVDDFFDAGIHNSGDSAKIATSPHENNHSCMPVDQHLKIAKSFGRQGQLFSQLAELESAIEHHPTSYEAWQAIGSYLLFVGKDQAGMEALERAHLLAPEEEENVI